MAVIQTALYFTFPPLMNLLKPWNVIIALGLSIITVLMYMDVFKNPDNYFKSLDLDFLNDVSFGYILKDIHRIGMIVIFHGCIIYAWYKNLYGASDIYYAIYYIHILIIYALIVQAKRK